MREPSQIHRDIQQLRAEHARLVSDDSKSMSQLKGAHARHKKALGDLHDELAQSLSLTAQRKAMGVEWMAEGPDSPLAPNAYTTRSSMPTSTNPAAAAWGAAVVKAAAGDGMEFKSLTPSGSVTVPSVLPGLVSPEPDRPISVLSLLPTTNLEGTDTFSFLRETERTFAASVVGEGQVKPTSVLSVERVDERVRTIAHLSEPIPRQTLADAVLLRSYVETSLVSGVELALEDQIISGTGLGEDLTGLNASSPQPQAFATDVITTARKGITLLENENIPPGAFILSPADWEKCELTAASDSGVFLMGADRLPVDRARRRLWGLPVAVSTVVADGTGWLADFAGSTRLWQRESIRVDWSENVTDDDGVSDFVKNLIRFRCEARFGFAVLRPLGVVKLDTAA